MAKEKDTQVTRSEIFAQTQTIVAEILRVDKTAISEESHIKNDLGADSLDQVTLLMALEEKFNEEISDEEAEKMLTVGDTVSFIEKKLATSVDSSL